MAECESCVVTVKEVGQVWLLDAKVLQGKTAGNAVLATWDLPEYAARYVRARAAGSPLEMFAAPEDAAQMSAGEMAAYTVYLQHPTEVLALVNLADHDVVVAYELPANRTFRPETPGDPKIAAPAGAIVNKAMAAVN